MPRSSFWNISRENELIKHYNNNKDINFICNYFNKSRNSIIQKLNYLNLDTSKYLVINKKCEGCDNIYKCEYKYRNERKYCSVSCSNKNRILSEEAKKKMSEAIKKKWQDGEYQKETKEQKTKRINALKQTWIDKLYEEDWGDLSFERKRKRLLHEQDYKCNKCGLKEWLGEPIKLEFEHIDGDNQNNKRENCEALCPNCHSYTETWRGGNKKVNKVSEKDYIEALRGNKNIRQALISLGVAPKGTNYKRAKKIIMKYDLEI